MKLKSILKLLLVAVFTTGCADANNKSSNGKYAFKAFLDMFKPLEFPIKINGCTINTQNLPLLQDTGYIRKNITFHAYGVIKPNGNYFAVIMLAGADCEIPTLVTYNKNGGKIDEKEINIGNCGSDCGYNCIEYMQLNNDYTLSASDTISSFDCDSLGNPIPGTEQHYVLFKLGKLLPSGKIELSEKIKRNVE